MIKRIVKLSFDPLKVATFMAVFEESKQKIRTVEGCHHLELWQDKTQPNILFTYSIWENETVLNNYRHSDLFQKTWAKTKVLFNDRPQAWSLELLEKLE